MANLITKFAVANYGDIQSLINNGSLKYPAYVFCRDTNTMVFIDKNQRMQNIGGFNQSSIIMVDELPTTDILSNTFYICNGIGYLKINDILVTVFKELSEEPGSLSYDDLTQVPLVNKKGTISAPIILSELNIGSYSVSGQYQVGGNLTTIYVPSSNVIVLVEKDDNCKYITKIDGKRVSIYTVTLETNEIVSDIYTTQSWIDEQGYSTKDYVDQAIADLYDRIVSETMVVITKHSLLENDMGFISSDDLGEISKEEIADLF